MLSMYVIITHKCVYVRIYACTHVVSVYIYVTLVASVHKLYIKLFCYSLLKKY